MISLLRLFGFPPPERRDSVRFHFAKGLPYTTRLSIAVLFLITGFGLQILNLSPWIGLPFLLLGVGLVMVKGYDSRIRWKSFDIDSGWTTVTFEKIREIDDLRKKSRNWDQDALDVSNSIGCLVLGSILVLAVILSVVVGTVMESFTVGLIILVDALLVFLPLWFSGLKFIMKHPNLNIKIKLILQIHEHFEKIKQAGELFSPALMLARGKDGKAVPMDARFSVKSAAAPTGFFGLQAMINLNLVQGKSYPYFYAVLAARPGFGLEPYRSKIPPIKNIICEFQKDSRAEVLVIRQKTTRKSGYHTPIRRCGEILGAALEGMREIVSVG